MPPVTRTAVDIVLGDVLGRKTQPSFRPDYRRRARFEMIAMIPGLRHILKPLLTRWWLDTANFWMIALTPIQVEHAINLMIEKNRIYGCRQLHALGTFGILVRSFDKAERILNIDSGLNSHITIMESRTDSVVDNFNYAILAVLLLRGQL